MRVDHAPSAALAAGAARRRPRRCGPRSSSAPPARSVLRRRSPRPARAPARPCARACAWARPSPARRPATARRRSPGTRARAPRRRRRLRSGRGARSSRPSRSEPRAAARGSCERARAGPRGRRRVGEQQVLEALPVEPQGLGQGVGELARGAPRSGPAAGAARPRQRSDFDASLIGLPRRAAEHLARRWSAARRGPRTRTAPRDPRRPACSGPGAPRGLRSAAGAAAGARRPHRRRHYRRAARRVKRAVAGRAGRA